MKFQLHNNFSLYMALKIMLNKSMFIYYICDKTFEMQTLAEFIENVLVMNAYVP